MNVRISADKIAVVSRMPTASSFIGVLTRKMTRTFRPGHLTSKEVTVASK